MIHWTRYGTDVLAWAVSIFLSAFLRYDFSTARISWIKLEILILIVALLQLAYGLLFKLYRSRFLPASFEEAKAVAYATVFTGFTAGMGLLATGGIMGVPRSIMAIATPLALILMFLARYLERAGMEKKRRPADTAVPALVVGAGFVGTHLIQWISTDVNSEYRVVGILDDDPKVRGRIVREVKVLGKVKDLASVAQDTNAELVVVALAEPSPELLRRVQDESRKAGLPVKVLPPVSELDTRSITTGDLRDLAPEDLLGRAVVRTNVSEIVGYLTGKRVLVTGAGGSIGEQLCVQINKYGPAELIMLDRDETGLQQAQINTFGYGLLDTPDVVLADIRDKEALATVFDKRRPEVVFHAAALKHLPMLEQYPDEAWKTNVLGSLNVMEAAKDAGVEVFVNISTDKAADPTSVLGYSKRVAERLTSWMGEDTGNRYLSVRFGNVIGSRGSMLPTFTKLIEDGQPLTVTHPNATRYFMTIPEACQLVLQAGGIGRTGEVLILDMGEPVRILDIAERMIAMSGKQIEIVFTGLRPGEKLDEILVSEEENADRPFHPKIAHAPVPGISPTELEKGRWDHAMRTKSERAGEEVRG